MGRRRRQLGKVADNIFDAAHAIINDRELDVYHATVEAQFTMDDVVAWLFPEDVIRKLKDAYPLAEVPYRSNFTMMGLPLPSGAKVSLSLDLDRVHMQCPKRDTVHNLLPDAPAIFSTLQAVCDVHAQFDKVRKVVDWFGEHNVTAGAAAYYWPTVKMLLPPKHAVHEATGERYREVTGIGDIIPLLRETTSIVAGACFCPKAPSVPRSQFSVTVGGVYAKTFQVL